MVNDCVMRPFLIFLPLAAGAISTLVMVRSGAPENFFGFCPSNAEVLYILDSGAGR